jgi:hypothetical protein
MMERKVDKQVAAPAETRTPNLCNQDNLSRVLSFPKFDHENPSSIRSLRLRA